MGYTHYWKHKEIPQDVWDKIVKDCKVLYKNMPKESGSFTLALNGCGAYKDPQFNKEHIYFNGGSGGERVKKDGAWEDADNSRDLGHETFELSRNPRDFTSCKTARKPYDLMVCACLIILKYHYPEAEVSSDGDTEDWMPAYHFVAEHFSTYVFEQLI